MRAEQQVIAVVIIWSDDHLADPRKYVYGLCNEMHGREFTTTRGRRVVTQILTKITLDDEVIPKLNHYWSRSNANPRPEEQALLDRVTGASGSFRLWIADLEFPNNGAAGRHHIRRYVEDGSIDTNGLLALSHSTDELEKVEVILSSKNVRYKGSTRKFTASELERTIAEWVDQRFPKDSA